MAVRSADEAPRARAVAPGPAGQGLREPVRRASGSVWFLLVSALSLRGLYYYPSLTVKGTLEVQELS